MQARRIINVLGDVVFKNGTVTWARIVAMFAITGSIANDFLMQDKPETVRSLVNIFADVIERLAADWICRQGGWVVSLLSFICL